MTSENVSHSLQIRGFFNASVYMRMAMLMKERDKGIKTKTVWV